jgi:hypothetical protein
MQIGRRRRGDLWLGHRVLPSYDDRDGAVEVAKAEPAEARRWDNLQPSLLMTINLVATDRFN